MPPPTTHAGYVTKCKFGVLRSPRHWLVLDQNGVLAFYVDKYYSWPVDEILMPAASVLAVTGAACVDVATQPWSPGVDAARRLQLRARDGDEAVAHSLEAATAADADAWAAAINPFFLGEQSGAGPPRPPSVPPDGAAAPPEPKRQHVNHGAGGRESNMVFVANGGALTPVANAAAAAAAGGLLSDLLRPSDVDLEAMLRFCNPPHAGRAAARSARLRQSDAFNFETTLEKQKTAALLFLAFMEDRDDALTALKPLFERLEVGRIPRGHRRNCLIDQISSAFSEIGITNHYICQVLAGLVDSRRVAIRVPIKPDGCCGYHALAVQQYLQQLATERCGGAPQSGLMDSDALARSGAVAAYLSTLLITDPECASIRANGLRRDAHIFIPKPAATVDPGAGCVAASANFAGLLDGDCARGAASSKTQPPTRAAGFCTSFSEHGAYMDITFLPIAQRFLPDPIWVFSCGAAFRQHLGVPNVSAFYCIAELDAPIVRAADKAPSIFELRDGDGRFVLRTGAPTPDIYEITALWHDQATEHYDIGLSPEGIRALCWLSRKAVPPNVLAAINVLDEIDVQAYLPTLQLADNEDVFFMSAAPIAL